MPLKQKIFALIVCLLVFVFTIEMVRRKRLREEYSVLWLTTSVTMFVLVIKYDWLVSLTSLIGAGMPTSTLFFGSIIFLVLIAVQFSIKISLLSEQVKSLVQENALLRHEFFRLQGEKVPDGRHLPGSAHTDSAVTPLPLEGSAVSTSKEVPPAEA